MELHALVFDANGTLDDVHSAAAQCERYRPGKGDEPDLAPDHALARISDLPPASRLAIRLGPAAGGQRRLVS